VIETTCDERPDVRRHNVIVGVVKLVTVIALAHSWDREQYQQRYDEHHMSGFAIMDRAVLHTAS
jgi:hypothetical protein